MMKVLVIEDEKDLREEITDMLRFSDFLVYSAADGLEGIELAGDISLDLIICDVKMPRLDGYSVLTHIRNHPANTNVPFIFLTAKADKKDLRYGMELGADDYLTKPFTYDELLSAIRTRLKKYDSVKTEAEKSIAELRRNLTQALPHELRTPLFGIIGYAELIETNAANLTSESIAEMAHWIGVSAHRLQRLTENYLLYTQLELWNRDQQKLQILQGARTDHPSILICNTAEAIASTYKREADLRPMLTSAPLAISENYLMKIAHELIDNAFKFSEKEQTVEITGTLDKDMYMFQIRDYGRGMSSDQMKRIGAYMQFDRCQHEQQGLGLGLVLAHRLVEIHKGVFTINSTPEDGTEITVALPIVI